jgi:hypothetical protein
MTPQRKPSPASLSNCACNRLKKPTITRTGAYCCWGSRPYKTGTIGYSTKCVLWDSANFAFTEF